jgi:diacylglycerol kinase (ATP)
MPLEIRDALVIINPNAGRARKAHLGPLDRARKILQGHGIATDVANTDGPGAATEIARRAVCDRREMVIVCGGDGTLNEVVNGLAGSNVPLALLPAGTANVLAKELGLPWNIERAATMVARSSHHRIALGMVTTETTGEAGRYFMSVGGAGPDGALVRAVNSALKRNTGTLAFWAEGIRQLGLYDFPRFRVTAGSEESVDATLVVVGRTKHYGGPFRITTEANIYGGDFELMLCTTRSRWKYVGYLTMLAAGKLRAARGAHFLRATTLRCEPLDRSEAWVQVDGEPAGKLPAEFRIVPDALTLAVPESASG